MINGWSVKNNGMPIHGSYPSFNAFVYCYSEVQDVGQIAATSGGKGDSFICFSNPARYVDMVREKLRPKIIEAVQQHTAPTERDQILATLEILDVNYRINYSDERKDRLVDEENIEDFNPMAFHPQDFFQKATAYSYEREVRTVWLPVASNPVNGSEVPLRIPHDWRFEDIDVDPSVLSSELKEHSLDLKTSPIKARRI